MKKKQRKYRLERRVNLLEERYKAITEIINGILEWIFKRRRK